MWVPVNHGVRAHPVFEGLPVGDFMGQVYLNVCATETMQGLNAPPVVGSLSFDWGQHGNSRPDYRGPREVSWGTDVGEATLGKGRVLLSTLRLLGNLEKDPVAERLLYNMVRWATASMGRVDPAGDSFQRKLEKHKFTPPGSM